MPLRLLACIQLQYVLNTDLFLLWEQLQLNQLVMLL